MQQLAEEPQALVGVTATVQVLLPLAGLVDLAALQAKLTRNLEKVEGNQVSLGTLE
ncbi:hypothetical protein [Synechococcus elongatus]|uniref:hypothetical protein n=1 Tax=Synechococcus elongatus TaxID=32046 RepID=UPI0030CA8A1D